jgi:hypothetical protein
MATIGRLYYGSNLLIGPSWPRTVERSASTTVTADAVAHTKGAWTELIASTDAASRWLFVDVVSASNGTNTGMLLDIGTGASGSETVRIANIGAGHKGSVVAQSVINSFSMLFPLNVASGTRIAARIQAITASRTATVAVSVLTDDGLHAIPTTLDTIGADTAASRGTNAPTSNTYAQVTASTSQAYQALVPTFTGATGTMANETSTFTIGTGASGSEQTLTEFTVSETNNELLGLGLGQQVPIYVGHIPSGTRLAVKQSAARNYRDVVLIGVPY